MLLNLDDREMPDLPHREDYERRRQRLPESLFDRLGRFINGYCDTRGQVRAGYFFSEPDFPPLYQELATALGSEDEANLFLGQMLWEALRVGRPTERWRFVRPEGGEDHPAGMQYWREG